MARRRNASRNKAKDPNLTKIIIVLLVLVAIAYGVMRATDWLNREFVGGDVLARVPDLLGEAEQLAASGNADRVKELLAPILNRVDDPAVTPKALLLLARAERAAGDVGAAREHLDRAIREFAGSQYLPEATLELALLEESEGHFDLATAHYRALAEKSPPGMRARALMGLARDAERAGEQVTARDLYRDALNDAAWNSAPWNEALDGLGRLNVALIFSETETPECDYYSIEPGDNLIDIGVKLNTTQGLLTRANGIVDAARIQPGQRLKYTPKEFRIVIERSTCRLFLLDRGGVFKRYRVGLGKPGHETTLGKYRIGNKQQDPTWFPQGRPSVPPGDPENELGSRWMPLVPEAEELPTDLGIHGTVAPETVGHYVSRGCPRLTNEMVEELYDLVVRSTPVEILDVLDPAALATSA